jgi:hypothetical protein
MQGGARWAPAPKDAITCARGAEIPIYRLEDGRVVETKENGVTCKNPALIELMLKFGDPLELERALNGRF